MVSKNARRNQGAKIMALCVAIITILCVIVIKSTNNGNMQTVTSNLDNRKSLADVEIGTVTIQCLDEQEKAIEGTTNRVEQGNVGEAYYIERPEISGYTYVGDEPITKAGRYELGNTDVKFIYKKAETEFKVETQNEGVDEAKENAVNVEINNSKKRSEKAVRIITVDESGNKIAGGEFNFYNNEDELLRAGKVINDDFYVGVITLSNDGEETYKIIQTKATAGYKKVQGDILLNLDVKWNNGTKTYEISGTSIGQANKNNAKSYINDNGEIIVEVTNQKYTDMYEMEVVYKTSAAMLDGKTIKVQKGSETVVEDKVQNGKLSVGTFEITNNASETYTITEGDELTDKYKKILTAEKPGKVYVEINYNDEKGQYELQVTGEDIDGFLVDYNETSKKITVYIETEINKYDLAIKKFVSSIDGRETDREPKATIENGKIAYSQKDEIEKAENNQIVEYTIRLYNESEATGYGKQIIENIPDGLVFIPEDETNKKYDWKMYEIDSEGNLKSTEDATKAKTIVTDSLVDVKIDGIDTNLNKVNSLDVQAVFRVDETRITSPDRIIENSVEIKKNENDDNSDNDKTTEKLYVEDDNVEEIDKYDLAVRKYVAQIDGENTNREPEVRIENGKVVYSQTSEIAKANNNQEVTYGIQIYNESEVTGYGKRIIEYIPEGLVYLPEHEINKQFGWVMYAQNNQGNLYKTEDASKAVVLVTDNLVDKEIIGRDNDTAYSIEALVCFKVDETKITSEDRIIENAVSIWKNNNDDNSDNDAITEKLYVRYFDLDVQKYIKQVVIKNESGEETKQVKNRDELLKIDVKKSLVNSTTLTITYDLEVKNIGEIEGYATELIDYIPENFELVEDGTWKLDKEQKAAITTKLENKLLQPGETTTISITFDWKLTEENIGSRINEGKITKYENPYEAIDLTDDNNGKREILVTIKTGGVWYCMTAIIAMAILIPVTAVVIKKRRN